VNEIPDRVALLEAITEWQAPPDRLPSQSKKQKKSVIAPSNGQFTSADD